jgi:hypothetical protein
MRIGPLYSDIRVLVGCESLPPTAPLCPRGECDVDCLCRETLLKKLTNLLLERKEWPSHGDGEDEWAGEL